MDLGIPQQRCKNADGGLRVFAHMLSKSKIQNSVIRFIVFCMINNILKKSMLKSISNKINF